VYPTHVQRTEALMQEALALTHAGVTVDLDVTEHDLARWLPYYLDHGGDPERVTVSSDAALNAPASLLAQLRQCVRVAGLSLDAVLPHLTSNTARVLKLQRKGRLREGNDGDLILLTQDSLELVTVIARGQPLLVDGVLQAHERFLDQSSRRVSLHGQKTV
jgi:beta-aspartyl-dipeptidase (metallo-type)